MQQRRIAGVLNVVALVVGAVALAVLLERIGWQASAHAIARTGGWFAVIAAIDLASVGCDAFAIHGFVRPHAAIAYRHVFAAQASGVAINRLTPGNSLGEPVKVTMLIRHVPSHVAVSAVAMFYVTTVFVGIAVLVLGVPITALLLDLPRRVEVAVWISTAILIALAVAIALVVRRGAAGTLIDALAALRILGKPRADRWRTELADIDARMRSGQGRARGVAGVVGSRVLNGTGTLVVLYAADVAMTGPVVVAMLTVGILITWLSNVVPLGLGLADGGNYALYGLLGASPAAGLAFAMVNRLRIVVLAAMGLMVMAISRMVSRV